MCRICTKYGIHVDSKYKRSDSNGMRWHLDSQENNLPHHVWSKCFGDFTDENCYALRFEKWNALIIFEHKSNCMRTWVEEWKCPPQPLIPLKGDSVGCFNDKNYNWSHRKREEKILQENLSTFFEEWEDEHQDQIPRLWTRCELIELFETVATENELLQKK